MGVRDALEPALGASVAAVGADGYSDKVRVYFHDYPLKIHKWAYEAAIAGQCIQQMAPESFWKYHDWIFENQASLTPQNLKDRVAEFASGQGLDSMKLSPCVDQERTKSVVDESIKRGQELGVRSTPTTFINGRKLSSNLEWGQLQRIIDYELEYQKVTKNAGDDCGCEVELDIPGAQ